MGRRPGQLTTYPSQLTNHTATWIAVRLPSVRRCNLRVRADVRHRDDHLVRRMVVPQQHRLEDRLCEPMPCLGRRLCRLPLSRSCRIRVPRTGIALHLDRDHSAVPGRQHVRALLLGRRVRRPLYPPTPALQVRHHKRLHLGLRKARTHVHCRFPTLDILGHRRSGTLELHVSCRLIHRFHSPTRRLPHLLTHGRTTSPPGSVMSRRFGGAQHQERDCAVENARRPPLLRGLVLRFEPILKREVIPDSSEQALPEHLVQWAIFGLRITLRERTDGRHEHLSLRANPLNAIRAGGV